jgi:predicted NBD/HSP70 family sugar kinase
MLTDATGYPVVAANDASLGALAESTFGSGRDVTDLIYLNGGASGIGGGVIAGGVSLAGIAGYAGEFGHTLVNSTGVLRDCGAVGFSGDGGGQGPTAQAGRAQRCRR